MKMTPLQPSEAKSISDLGARYPLLIEMVKRPNQFDALCAILVAGAATYGEQACRSLFGSKLETVDDKSADPMVAAIHELISINKSMLSIQQHVNDSVKTVNVDSLAGLVDQSIVERPTKRRKVMDGARTGLLRISDVEKSGETPVADAEVHGTKIGFASFLKLPLGTNNSAVRFAGTMDLDTSSIKLRV